MKSGQRTVRVRCPPQLQHMAQLRSLPEPQPSPPGRTFAEVLELYIGDKSPAWKGGKGGDEANAHRRLLKTSIAGLPLATIDAPAVRGALAQWLGTATSEKMRTKIASVWAWARANGMITGGENPAAVLRGALPAVGTKVAHHPAMPWTDVPALMQELKAIGTPAAKALQWTIRTAARAGDARFNLGRNPRRRLDNWRAHEGRRRASRTSDQRNAFVVRSTWQ